MTLSVRASSKPFLTLNEARFLFPFSFFSFSTLQYNNKFLFHAAVAEPKLLVRVLNTVRNRPVVALRFFRWAERQTGFKRSEISYSVILDILARNGLMRSAYCVMEKVVSVKMENGVIDVVSSSEVSMPSVKLILDLLLWIYVKKSLLEKCLLVFYKMVSKGLLPDVKNCNRVLRLLRDRDNNIDVAREVYNVMVIWRGGTNQSDKG